MSDRLHERLDAKIGELRAAGRSISLIYACPADIQQLFAEIGEMAILLDCDPNRDTAWYRDVELNASEEPGTWLLVPGEAGEQRIPV